MINQLAVNPATETYTFTQILGTPIYTGNEINAASIGHFRMLHLNEQIEAAFGTIAETGFYFNTDAHDLLENMRLNIKNLIETDQPLKTLIMTATGLFTIKTVLGSSKDDATQSLSFSLYTGGNEVTGGTLLFTETAVKAVNSFVASDTAVLIRNGLPMN